MDCGICYYNYSREEDIFNLKCCKNNIICLRCVHLLTTPLCPFCRARISDLPETATKRMAMSYEAESTLRAPTLSPFIITPPQHHAHTPPWMTSTSMPSMRNSSGDDIYIDSRTMRRRLRRLRKLQQREDDRIHNRNLTRVLRESRSSTRNSIQQQIQQDREIFEMDL